MCERDCQGPALQRGTPLYQHQPVSLIGAFIKSFLHQNGGVLVRHEVQRLVHELP